MSKKVNSDLEKMNRDRRKAEEAYLANQQAVLNVHRIIKEGIDNTDDLVDYLVFGIEDAKVMEDAGRKANNSIVYAEAIAVRREFGKLIDLLAKAGERADEEAEHGGERKHRENNEGDESYA